MALKNTVMWLSFTVPALAAATPTYHKDIVPILQRSCQGCHRPGEAGPMSFMTYKETRPWAAAIREVVATKKMPPWGADSAHGKFANDRSLNAKEIETISAWALAKAPEGDPKDAPAPIKFVQGWNIGQPDLVIEVPKPYAVPAKGTLEYTYFVVPSGFQEDRWVNAAEIRPEARAQVHHVIVYIREPGSKWLKNAPIGEPYVRPFTVDPKTGETRRNEGGMGEFLVGYAPGVPAAGYGPGRAKLVKAGSDLVFELHYTANGQEAQDRSKVGIIFAKEPPRERVMTVGASNRKFVIPPGASDHPVDSRITFYGDAKILTYAPHMHVRGKTFRYELVGKDGQRETLLNVPRYDFNWQTWYEPAEPLKVTNGTTIECFATFDNSPNNKANPNPKAEVRWGDQSWEEMMIGFMEIAFDARQDPRSILQKPKQPARSDPSGE